MAVVVPLLGLRDGRHAGGQEKQTASPGGAQALSRVSLPVSQHISLNRPGLQIDPPAPNCLEGQDRPESGLIR